MQQCAAGKKPSGVAIEVCVSTRQIQRLYAQYRKTGRPHVPQRPGRKPKPKPDKATVKTVLGRYDKDPAGVMHTANQLRQDGYHISYDTVYKIMRENGLVKQSAAKSQRRKWVRYERKYSNAMWHVDWHEMKCGPWRGLNLVVYLDDASRCVVSARLFPQATSENAVIALKEAIEGFGVPATILSDNGSCFVGARRRKVPGNWTPTAFEATLLDRGIELINSRPYHPQTNGKLERFFRSLEEGIEHYGSLSAYIEYYNVRRFHWSLNVERCETPILAFANKHADEAIRKKNPKWMEEDTKDGAT